jgi:hypothetical protein
MNHPIKLKNIQYFKNKKLIYQDHSQKYLRNFLYKNRLNSSKMGLLIQTKMKLLLEFLRQINLNYINLKTLTVKIKQGLRRCNHLVYSPIKSKNKSRRQVVPIYFQCNKLIIFYTKVIIIIFLAI